MDRTIGVQLENKEQKFEIMEKKSKLRDERKKIYINDDTTWKERQNKREILRKRKELEQKGIKCKMSYNKISTEKEEFYWNEEIEKWFRREKTETALQNN